MRSRLVILLLALVVLPLGLTAWAGWLFWQREADNWRLQQKAQATGKLQERQQMLDEVIQAMATKLHALLGTGSSDESALRDLAAAQPLIRTAFCIDKVGEVKIPAAARPDLLSADDREFLQRTASIWSRGSLTGVQSLDEAGGQGGQAALPSHGWHVWYHQDGPHWLYWQRNADQSITGFEIERMAFLSRVAESLKANDMPDCIRLTSADGELLAQQGGFQPAPSLDPLATLACTPPMQHWHWEFFAAPGAGSLPQAWSYLLGFGGIASLFAAVGLLLCMGYARDLRVAAQRVSFVNQVSHELKTPLTNIRLYVDLARESAGAEGNSMLDVVEEETSRLSRMIHNVLTFAQHEKKTLDVHPAPGDLTAVVRPAVDIWRPLLARKHIDIRVEDILQQTAYFDEDAVEQILGNMLSNVEKYAVSATHVDINIGTKNGQVELSLHDDGPGISKHERPHVFDAFYRARNDLTEGVSGTGLGLSIARMLAVRQGGDLAVAATKRGACFVLSLPLQEKQAKLIHS